MKNQDLDKLSPEIQQKGLKVMFFGTSNFALPVLEQLLLNGYSISAVFTGGGPIEIEAQKHGIKVFKPTSLKKNDDALEKFKLLNPDLCIVAAYGKIIPSSYMSIPRYGFVNVHPSVLPRYRGPSPVQTAILNGDTETGASVMILDQEVDHGPILGSVKYKISKTKYNEEISKEIFELGGKLLIKTLPPYLKNQLIPVEQNHDQATYSRKFQRQDSKINWNKNVEEIYNQIRSLNPEPGTWATWKNRILNIKTGQSSYLEAKLPSIPGTILRIDNMNNDIAVTTKTCYLILKQIQLEGGKEMDAQSFLNGHPDFLGSKLE